MSLMIEDLKKMAADKACEFVKDGMLIGLGTGSTAKYVVENLGEKVKSGKLKIKATPTSVATKELAESFGIEMLNIDEIEYGEIDLVIDGADAIDLKTGICIKGGGGAHYWEKQVAERAKRMIVVADDSKVVMSFAGLKIPVEVEIDKKEIVAEQIDVTYRDVLSDFGNAIGDVAYDGSLDILVFEEYLMKVDGVIETGVFASLVDEVVVARKNGEVEVVEIDYN